LVFFFWLGGFSQKVGPMATFGQKPKTAKTTPKNNYKIIFGFPKEPLHHPLLYYYQ